MILKSYIRNYLLEATSSIAFPAKDVSGKSQHEKAASYQKDMSSLNDDEVLLKVLENVGDNCFVSFVDRYDDEIPRLEINPTVQYDTPHGNYSYPLTVNVLKEIIEKSKIGGTSFALNRPYFHMFKKANKINSINIEKDGSNSYKGNANKDLKTIISTALMFAISKESEDNVALKSIEKENNKNKTKKLFDYSKDLCDQINSMSRFTQNIPLLAKSMNSIISYNDGIVPSDIKNKIVSLLKSVITNLAFSKSNKFWLARENDLSDFHVLYYACWIFSIALSNIKSDMSSPEEDKLITGPVFTMLLNSIDIDFINDKGSTTLHSNEPIQAVYLNSSKKESVVLIGTFNNIFKKSNSGNLYNTILSGIQNNNNEVTINKVVDLLEKNKSLLDLFDSELFNDPKFSQDISFERKAAWKELTSQKMTILKIKYFHKSNDVFNFDINIDEDNDSMIILNIDLKDKFKNSNDFQQFEMIKKSLKSMSEVTYNEINYIVLFLQKYKGKNIYKFINYNPAENINKIMDKFMYYSNNYEGPNILAVNKTIGEFINFSQELFYLAEFSSDFKNNTQLPTNLDVEEEAIPDYVKEDAINFTQKNEVVSLIFDDTSSKDFVFVDIGLQDNFKNHTKDFKISTLYSLSEMFSYAYLKEDIILPVLSAHKKDAVFKIKNQSKILELKKFIDEFEPVVIKEMPSAEDEVRSWFNILRLLLNFANKL